MLAFAGNDGANLATTNGDVDWAHAVHPEHREDVRRQGPGAPPLLVPGHRRHDQLAAQHHQGAVQRRGRAQGAEHGRRPRPNHQGRHERLHRARRLHRPLRHLRQVARHSDGRGQLRLDQAGRRRRQRAARQGRLPKGADGKRTLKDGEPFEFKISVGAASSDWLSVANIIAQNLAKSGSRPRWTPRTGRPSWPATRRAASTPASCGATTTPARTSTSARAMATATVKPVGKQDHRELPPLRRRQGRRAARRVRRRTGDEAKQKDIGTSSRKQYNDDAPWSRCSPAREWGAYNDTRFTGWPTEGNPYATLSTRRHHGPRADLARTAQVDRSAPQAQQPGGCPVPDHRRRAAAANPLPQYPNGGKPCVLSCAAWGSTWSPSGPPSP